MVVVTAVSTFICPVSEPLVTGVSYSTLWRLKTGKSLGIRHPDRARNVFDNKNLARRDGRQRRLADRELDLKRSPRVIVDIADQDGI